MALTPEEIDALDVEAPSSQAFPPSRSLAGRGLTPEQIDALPTSASTPGLSPAEIDAVPIQPAPPKLNVRAPARYSTDAVTGGGRRASLPSGSTPSMLDELDPGAARTVVETGRMVGRTLDLGGQVLKAAASDVIELPAQVAGYLPPARNLSQFSKTTNPLDVIGGATLNPDTGTWEETKPAVPLPYEQYLNKAGMLERFVGKAVLSLAEMEPRLAASFALGGVGAPPSLAAGLPMLVDDQGRYDPMGAAIAAGLPGVARAGEGAVAGLLSKTPIARVVVHVLGEDPLKLKGKIVQKLGGIEFSNDSFRKFLEQGGGFLASNAYLAAAKAPEIAKLPPEQRGQAILDLVASNLAPALLGFIKPGMSHTLEAKAPEIAPQLAELVAELKAAQTKGPNATSKEPVKGSVPVEPKGTPPVGQTPAEASAGDSLSSPAGQPPVVQPVAPEIQTGQTGAVAPIKQTVAEIQAEQAADKLKLIQDRVATGIDPNHIRIAVTKMPEIPNGAADSVQVDEVHPTLGNTFSSNAEQLRALGLDMPTTAELKNLPAGQYTLPQAQKMLADLEKPAVPKPDFIADSTHPVGTRQWRISNSVPEDWKVTPMADGGWVAESPVTKKKGQWGKLVKTADKDGNGREFGVASEKPVKESVPKQPPVKTEPLNQNVSEGDIVNQIRAILASPAEGQVKGTQIRAMAKTLGITVKEMQERVESEIVKIADEALRTPAFQGGKSTFNDAVSIYNRQPLLSARTSTSVVDQAYSTPVPLAVALHHALSVTPMTSEYDATGGNGMLLIGSNKATSQGNELNPARAAALKALGIGVVTQNDATTYTPSAKFDVVNLNPPFGSINNVNYGGYGIGRLEHLIALKGFEAMADNGVGSVIMGAKLHGGEMGKGAQWVFENYVHAHYNVVATFELEGDLYAKQGASFPVRVLVVAGRRQLPLPMGDYAQKTVPRFKTWDEVWTEAERIRNDIEARRTRMVSGESTGLSVPPAGQGAAAGQPGGIPGAAKPAPSATGGGGVTGGSGQRKPGVGKQPVAGGAQRPSGRSPSIPQNKPVSVSQPGGTGIKAPPVAGGVGGSADVAGDVAAGSTATGGGPDAGKLSGSGAVDRPAGDLAGMSENELDSILDEAAGGSKPTTKSAGQIAKEAAAAGVEGAGEALKGLHDLFGGGAHLGSGPSFNEKTYAKAKPHFQQAYEQFKKAGKSLKEFAQFIFQKFSATVKPYLKRFIQELQKLASPPVDEGKVPKPPPDVKATEHQVPYRPKSKAEPFGTLLPKGIAEGVHAALDELEKRRGNLDEFVANRLNMDVSQAMRVMAAEQVDSVALAIDQIETGGAMIVGSQTGIGKGRIGAAVLRYAMVQGKIPIFFSKDPKLFTDMYGDLADIYGLSNPNLLTAIVKPLIFGEPSKASIVNLDGTVLHKAPAKPAQDRAMQSVLEDGMEESGYNAIFSTYSQVNTRNARQQFLEALAQQSPTIIVMDEAHEAAGDSETSMQAAFFSGGQVKRGQGANQVTISVPGLLNRAGTKVPMGGGVLYMSATFAKRAENMPVYFRTSLSKAAQSFPQIVEAMKKGGTALQQAVSEALAKAGQYVRHERDFTGASYDMQTVDVGNVPDFVEKVDAVTDVLSEIVAFSGAMRELVAGSTAMSDSSIDMTDFASIVHNQVGQLLLAAKASAIVEACIASHKRGEKPVVALMNTMESFLDQWGDDNGIKPGQTIKLRWTELLKYALDRTLRMSEELPNGDTEITQVNPHDFTGMGERYDAIRLAADSIESNFPISPIDYIIQKLAKAGIKMAELTGRTSGLEYTDFETGGAIYRRFKKANKNTIVNGFNDDTYNGMLLNASGSTGLSAHASVKFKAQQPRAMFIAQPAPDINVFMQTLGRIFRTGMVMTGINEKGQPYGAKYVHMVLPVQAEIRPAVMAARKMKSLNANTTAEADNAIKIEAEDIFNKYGDAIISEYLDSRPDLQMATGLSVGLKKDGSLEYDPDVARKFTGRMSYRPDAEQKAAYNYILPAYREKIEQLKATGEYDLEVVVHDDWDGVMQSDQELAHGTDDTNIFTAGVRLQQWQVADHRHVPTGSEMLTEFRRKLESPEKLQEKWQAAQDRIAALIAARRAKLETDLAASAKESDQNVIRNQLGMLDDVVTRWTGTQARLEEILRDSGGVVELTNRETGDKYHAMLVDAKFPTTGLRAGPSNFRFKFEINAPGGVLYLTALDFTTGGDNGWGKEWSDATPSDLTGGAKGARYNRFFVTGNPIQGYVATGGKGKMVRFTSRSSEAEAARVVSGLLMPNNWGPQNLAADLRLDLVSGRAALHFLETYGQKGYSDYVALEAGGIVNIKKSYGGDSYTVSTSAARRTGGNIYLDAALLRTTGDFTKVGSRMTVDVDARDIPKVVDRIMAITGTKFRPVGQTDALVPQVKDSNIKGGKKGSIEEPSPVETPKPPAVARSVSEMILSLPHVGLNPQAEAMLGAFLELPVVEKLPKLQFKISDALAQGWQGAYFQGLIELTRNANPDTGPHELLHAVWEILPDDIQAEFTRMREATIDKLIQEAITDGKEDTAKVLADLKQNPSASGEDFLSRNYPAALRSTIYPLSSPEEFFTHSGSERFQQRVGSMVEGFWARVKQIIGDFIAAIKKALKLRQNQREWLDNILKGNFDPTRGDMRETFDREKQASLSPEDQAAELARLEEAEGDRVPTKVFGEEYYVLNREQITTESIAASSALAKEMLDAAGLPASEQVIPADDQHPDRRAWIMEPQGRDMTTSGEALLKRLKEEIATKEAAPKSADRLANILNTIVINFELGTKSAMGYMDPGVRLELFSVAQSDRSARGAALGALAGYKKDLVFMGRNLDVVLGRIWSDAFGGDTLRGVLDDLRAELAAAKARGDTLEQQNKALQKALDASLKKKGRRKLARSMGSGTKIGKKILEKVQSGDDEAWDSLKEMAILKGWKVPTDQDLAKMKAWADELDRLQVLSDAEKAAAGSDPADILLAQHEKTAATDARQSVLRHNIETLWTRLTQPLTLRTQTGRANLSSALGEYISANLLLKVGFATRQVVDIMTQGAMHTPSRAVAHALEIHENEIAAGRRSKADVLPLWGDIGDALKQAYAQRTAALRSSLSATLGVLKGTEEGRNVARLLERVSLFDRAMQKADELALAGRKTESALLRMFTWMRFGYRVAQALDNLHGLPAVYQEMRQQVVAECRSQGMTRAEASVKADFVMGDMKAEWLRAIPDAQVWLETNGIEATDKHVKAAAWRMVLARQYERMRSLGLPADDFEERNRVLLNTVGWNLPEKGGLGGFTADTMRRAARLAGQVAGAPLVMAPITFPVSIAITAATRFGNAISIIINRKLSFTPLGFAPGAFGVDERNTDENGIAKGGSPWFKSEQDRRQRKVEAAGGSLVGAALLGLVLAGVIRVLLKWPKDKEERQLWDAQGWKPGQVHIPTGDGRHIILSMNTGPLVAVVPALSMGGAIRDMLDDRAKRQAKLNADAEKRGLLPGQIRPINTGDLLAAGVSAGWSAITSGRTLSGLIGSFTDYGGFHPVKTVASLASSLTPGLPGLQEVSRMAGVTLDTQMASIWDFMLPLPTSKAAQVNLLGDPVGSANDVQRLVQTLTGGNYPFPVSDKERQEAAGYNVMFATGYRPPSIDPNRGYVFGGEFRPMTDKELADYTIARGQGLKRELSDLGPDASLQGAKEAYQRANSAALDGVGAQTLGQTTAGGGGATPAGAAATGAGGRAIAGRAASGRVVGQPRASNTPLSRVGGSIRASRGGRAPSVRGAGRALGSSRGPSLRRGRGLKLPSKSTGGRAPSLRRR